VVVAAELLLEQPVHALDLLLLAKLLAVVTGTTLATLTVLARGVWAALVAALLGEAAIAFEVELRIFAAAKATGGSGVASHLKRSLQNLEKRS
jgi:hypothetical protein